MQTSLAQIFMLDFQAARYLMEKDVAQQAGYDHPTSIPTGVFNRHVARLEPSNPPDRFLLARPTAGAVA